MTTLFLANVGTRDVQLSDESLLPEELRGKASPRLVGEEILKDYRRYAGTLQVPMIAACLRWLLEERQVSPTELHVHLFASDQAAPPTTPERQWLQDTLPFAEVIRHFLLDGGLVYAVESAGKRHGRESCPLRLAGSQVHIHAVKGNPADYVGMLDFFTQKLAHLAERVDPAADIYMEVSGGTPAMTSMLIVAGVEAFGRRVQTLYVEPGARQPYPLDIARRLLARRAREAFCAQVKVYAYAAAAEILASDKNLLVEDVRRQDVLSALLEYGRRRLAFDFRRAREALSTACQYADQSVAPHLRQWWRELDPAERDTVVLVQELIHSTRILYRMGDYADFTQRLFRFQEASFRHLAERMGMRYKDEDEKRVDPAWVRSVPGLSDFLDNYRTPDGQALRWMDVELNRVNLGAFADFFTRNDHAAIPLWPAVEKLHRLSGVADLRNKGLAGHGFQGIGKEDLDAAWGEDADGILPLMEQVFQALFGYPVGDSPYDGLNEVLLKLLAP